MGESEMRRTHGEEALPLVVWLETMLLKVEDATIASLVWLALLVAAVVVEADDLPAERTVETSLKEVLLALKAVDESLLDPRVGFSLEKADEAALSLLTLPTLLNSLVREPSIGKDESEERDVRLDTVEVGRGGGMAERVMVSRGRALEVTVAAELARVGG